jgi:deazaflavin-dependent oxidoreductase (nitroreductase family)
MMSNLIQKIRDRIRAFNKHTFNPIILKSAGSQRSPFAVIHHVGRRSGKPYETPVIAEPVTNGFVFALTYGPEVDWYRNVLAAGRGTIVWHGKEYPIEQPEILDIKTGVRAFPLLERLILSLLGIRHFFRMRFPSGSGIAQSTSVH